MDVKRWWRLTVLGPAENDAPDAWRRSAYRSTYFIIVLLGFVVSFLVKLGFFQDVADYR